jgi:hypothetical protein
MMTENSILGDNLALLSLRVAQEVDRRLKGEKFDSSVFADFGKELSRASGIGERQSTAFLHSDPLTADVFAQAVEQTSHEPIRDIAALGDAMLKIIRPLNEQGESLSKESLKAVKAFCLSLHRSMMAQKLPSIHEGESSLEDELRFV